MMSHQQAGGTPNSQRQIDPNLVDLKVRVPLSLRRKVRAMAVEAGRTTADVTIELLVKALTTEPSEEELLARVFRRRWSAALYNSVDAQRAAKRLSWVELVQQWSEQHRADAAGLPPIAKPFSAPPMAPPRPRAREGFIPETQVVDVTQDSASETDSGVRPSLQKKVAT
jgi:hypothetical protein